MLGFISRTVGPRSTKLFSKLYKSWVHPILEYCSPVWYPHFKKDSVILEKVQRKTSRYAVRNIGRDMSYEECLRALSWPTLHQRLFSSLTECSRTVNYFIYTYLIYLYLFNLFIFYLIIYLYLIILGDKLERDNLFCFFSPFIGIWIV